MSPVLLSLMSNIRRNTKAGFSEARQAESKSVLRHLEFRDLPVTLPANVIFRQCSSSTQCGQYGCGVFCSLPHLSEVAMISGNSLSGPSGPASVLPITRDANVQASPSNLGPPSKENGKDGIPTVAPNTLNGHYGHLPTYQSLDVVYEQKYAPDAPGEELGAQARVWSVYNDEARIADAEKVRRLNGTLDVLLVFVSEPIPAIVAGLL